MGVPATTGVLRTKITDMQIGDYIKGTYANNGTTTDLGYFKDIGDGTPGAAEIPVTGTDSFGTTGKFFYLVKVAKGLLISDRVVAHSRTWDALNAANMIQGKSFVSSPSASTNFLNNVGTFSTILNPNTVTDAIVLSAFEGGEKHIQYDYTTPMIVDKFKIKTYLNSSGYEPLKGFAIQGSNDGFKTIKELYNGEHLAPGTVVEFSFQNNERYLSYRLVCKTWHPGNGGDGQIITYAIPVVKDAPRVRSLTGGVAYADANGNISLTDKGFGAWPTNNEWDKYIAKFPTDKIQSGKSLDDVFHGNSFRTWCQDTPANNTFNPQNNFQATNVQRVVRGKYQNETSSLFNFNTSSASTIDMGFRPVFEYKEV